MKYHSDIHEQRQLYKRVRENGQVIENFNSEVQEKNSVRVSVCCIWKSSLEMSQQMAEHRLMRAVDYDHMKKRKKILFAF